MNPNALTYESWETLARVTVEIPKLDEVLKEELRVDSISDLNEAQAKHLISILSSLPKLRASLHERAVAALTDYQKDLNLVKVNPAVAAEIITEYQITELAGVYIVSQVDKELFGINSPNDVK